MPRNKLKAAREAANLSQKELADLIGAGRKAVSAWETGARRPQPGYRRRLREKLNNYDPDLFDNEETALREPCHVEGAGATEGSACCL